MRATLIADDLTGACDAAAPFAGRGRVAVFVNAASPGAEWNVIAVDTESRQHEPADAADAVRAAVTRLGPRVGGLLFKKIDSTLRGAIGAELEAFLEATGRDAALLCPSFPAQGRTVEHGTLLVSGIPAHESPIARDPTYPGPTSDVAEIVRLGARRPVSLLTLDRVRGDPEALARVLGAARDRVVVADAVTDSDLATLADATLRSRLVMAGSAGLAHAVAQAGGQAGPPAPLPRGHAWLIVAGSQHPSTRAQLERLEGAGIVGARLDDTSDPDLTPLIEEIKSGRPVFIATSNAGAAGPVSGHAPSFRLAALAARMLAHSRPDLIAVTGGETALALFRALGAQRLELTGAPSSGLALGDAIIDSTSRVPLLTKAGGFGSPDLFLALLGGTSP
jgi:uncharacterized protein YgbK (DUF1537 family)